jgi:hypothetical protein
VNLFPANAKSGMAPHEDIAVFCTVIVMLTTDDSDATALQMGWSGEYGALSMTAGEIIVFRGVRHALPVCIRRQNRLTINFFF